MLCDMVHRVYGCIIHGKASEWVEDGSGDGSGPKTLSEEGIKRQEGDTLGKFLVVAHGYKYFKVRFGPHLFHADYFFLI